ncbi:hypothetical protein B0A52_08184 [Exophiala mesophila]|uniref:Zn(2)-C6 fungal-type domain-containing protein n=1 Tax=Exophiala mesophila TaxID=212818 RepID=A0A438MVA7_EXOME|nr:hypothetical protein B0A52_08184 [Exophiala mesophila]
MSGSPPPDPPVDPPQIAGRRRKRSESPPRITVGPLASPSTPVEHGSLRPFAQSAVDDNRPGSSAQFHPHASRYPPSSLYPSSSSTPSGYVAATVPDFPRPQDPISPRATRKPKAHVASACVNCKRKHLRCDNNRPCNRCINNNKADSCRDVEHKKRGRPPLKPEDPTTRRLHEQPTPQSGSSGEPMRRYSGSDPAYQPASAYPPLRPHPLHSQRVPFPPIMYAPPSVSPTHITATGTFTSPTPQYSSGPTSIGQAPGSYHPPQTDPLRPLSSYSGMSNYPPLHNQIPPHQTHYSNPIFSRPSLPQSSVGDSLPPLHGPGSLQLPPIRQSAPIGPIDPAISEQQNRPQSQQSTRGEQGRRDRSQEPQAKRPKMDIQGILGPRDRE